MLMGHYMNEVEYNANGNTVSTPRLQEHEWENSQLSISRRRPSVSGD